MGRHKKYLTEEEIKKAKKKYYKDNKEKLLEYQKEYNKEYCKKYYLGNKEYYKQYYLENKEKISGCRKKYNQTKNGRAHCILNCYRREDLIHNRGECTLTAQWIVDNIFSKPCNYCGETDWHKLGCDRIDNSKPHTPDNVVPCCSECNSKRGRKTYEEFVEETMYK